MCNLNRGPMIVKLEDFVNTSPSRGQIAELIRKWGNASSISLLDPACQIFSVPEIDGVIGYRTGWGCAVAYGDPVCALADVPALAEAFQRYCQVRNWRNIYATVSERFALWAINHISSAAVQVGEELIFNPRRNPETGAIARKLRNKVSHARHSGVIVNEYTMRNKPLESAIEQVASSWLKSRHGPQIYLSHVNLFAERTGKRWFYACQEGRIVGVLLLNQLVARQGWLVNMVMATPDASPGTSELLVISALDALRFEGTSLVTVGTLPLERLDKIVGLGWFSRWMARTSFQVAKRIFPINGRLKYWQKFQPHQSEGSYLLFSHSNVGLRDLAGVMSALNVWSS